LGNLNRGERAPKIAAIRTSAKKNLTGPINTLLKPCNVRTRCRNLEKRRKSSGSGRPGSLRDGNGGRFSRWRHPKSIEKGARKLWGG